MIPRYLTAPVRLPGDAGIQDVFRTLAGNAARTAAIADEVACAYAQGRKVLALTERTEHLEAIAAALVGRAPAVFTLHGRLSKKQRAALVEQLDALPSDAPRVLLATDAASEGLDLQNHCSRLIHFEIPCNPIRMEQRNGRVDRHGFRRANQGTGPTSLTRSFPSHLGLSLNRPTALC